MTARGPAAVALPVRTLAVARLPQLTGPSNYPVAELVLALEAAGLPPAPAVPPPVGRLAERLGLNRSMARRGGSAVLVPLMGPAAACLFPHSMTHECVVVCWDVWSPDDDAWARLFRRHQVSRAVMTAREAAGRWHARGLRTAWVPEAVDPPPGSPGPPLTGRRIDVLELGRRHPGYHAAITPVLDRAGRVHRYERVRGEVVFPTRAELMAGLRDTVVNVCFPGSVTHPERSGDIETLTRRYLEAMAAGTVLVGSAPAELVDLFGYDPVVPVDPDDPGRQLVEVLAHAERYAPLVARNYARYLEVGTLRARVPRLLDVLHSWGFRW